MKDQSRFILMLILAVTLFPSMALALASNNIPLDSPIYLYLEKLTGSVSLRLMSRE